MCWFVGVCFFVVSLFFLTCRPIYIYIYIIFFVKVVVWCHIICKVLKSYWELVTEIWDYYSQLKLMNDYEKCASIRSVFWWLIIHFIYIYVPIVMYFMKNKNELRVVFYICISVFLWFCLWSKRKWENTKANKADKHDEKVYFTTWYIQSFPLHVYVYMLCRIRFKREWMSLPT